jgi:hypothetical protein
VAYQDQTAGQTFDQSNYDSTYDGSNAFDDSTDTFWQVANPGSSEWIEVEFSAAKAITRLSMGPISFGDINKLCNEITVKASSTGSFSGEETQLYTTTEAVWYSGTWSDYDFTNEAGFYFYRIYFADFQSATVFIIREIELSLDVEAAEVEADLSDGASVADTIDGFNLTDGVVDAAGLGDSVDGFSTDDELNDAAALGDFSDGYSETSRSIADAAGLGDTSDGFNWTAWLATNRDLAVVRYYCTLTGAADGLADVTLPISSFQARKRTDQRDYLSVVVPGVAYADAIASRSNGQIYIEMAYLLDGVESVREEIIRADLEKIDIHEGTRNRSITLSGYGDGSMPARAASIRGSNYKATYSGSMSFRFPQADPYLNPGDALTVLDTGDSMTVDQITYAISAGGAKFMEVREA